MIRPAALASFALGVAASQALAAQVIGDSRAPLSVDESNLAFRLVESQPDRPTFGGHTPSIDVRQMAEWIAASGDNSGLPYIIVDKRDAKVFLFNGRSAILGVASALLGLGRGDDSAAGIGHRRLATMAPVERTTPAGRFQASLGFDLEQDVLWIDYDKALSLHRVIVGNPLDRRHQRLVSPAVSDNRISYGCINVSASFYEEVVIPAFKGTVGMVYILPETKTLDQVFAIDDSNAPL